MQGATLDFLLSRSIQGATEESTAKGLVEVLRQRLPMEALKTRSPPLAAFIDRLDLYFASVRLASSPSASPHSPAASPSTFFGKGDGGVHPILDNKPLVVAQHLTLIESELFRRITEDEIVQQPWRGDDPVEPTPQRRAEPIPADNFLRIIMWFNHVTKWACTEVRRVLSLFSFVRVSFADGKRGR